jgi:hypothetical protein
MKSKTNISIAAGLILGLGLVAQAGAAITVQNYWSMGEDNNPLPTDSVGHKNFTGNFSDVVSSAHSPAGGSTSSIDYNGFAGTYMANTPDFITVPTTNWVFEVDVNFNSLTAGQSVNIASLGTDTVGDGSINGWAKIGYSGGNIFFGQENKSFGALWDPAINTGQWYELAYAQFDGHIHGYVNGVEATDFGSGNQDPSINNNGQVHLGVHPGGGQNLDGLLDNVRFSTFAEGAFSTNDLFSNAVPEPTPMVALALGALVLIRRRKRA